MNPDDAPAIDPDRTFDPLAGTQTSSLAAPTPTPATARFAPGVTVMSDTPFTTDLSVWWSTPTVLTLALVLGLLAFAYRAARGGQLLFGEVLHE